MEEVISKLVSWDSQENIALHGHTGPVWSVKPTPDDSFLFSGGEDNNILIWDLKSEQNIGILSGHTNTVNALELCLNSEVLVSGAWDGSIRIWDWRSQLQIGELVGHTAGVYVFLTTISTKILVSGSGDYSAKVWDVETRVLLASLSNSPNSIFAMALQPDEKVLVTGGWNGVIRVWDFAAYTQLSEHQSSSEVVQCMAITPDGAYLVFGTRGNKVKIWTWSTKVEYMCFELHNNWVRNLVVTADSKYFISASADKTIRMVNIEEKCQVFNFDKNDGYIFALCLGNDGKKLYSGASDKIVRIREIGVVRDVKTLTGHTMCIMSVAFTANGQFLVTGSEDTSVRKWSLETLTQVFSTNFHGDTVWAVCVTDDCQKILSVSGDKKLVVMDFDGNLISTLEGHSNPIFCVAASCSNLLAVTGAQDKNVILWDLQSLSQVQVLQGHTDTVFSVKFCENDKKIVSGSADYTVRVWMTNPVSIETVIRIQGGMIESVDISSDLRFMAVGDRNNQVHLWDWNTLKHIKTFEGHRKWVKSVKFAPDSKTILSSSNDFSIRMWNTEDLNLDYSCFGHKNTIRCVAVSPDGKLMASVSEDRTVRIWPMVNEDFLGIVDYVGVYDDFLLKNCILMDMFPKKYCHFIFSKLKVNVLHVYCYRGKAELLLQALQAGVCIKRDAHKNSPLFYALQRNQVNCIETFIGFLLENLYENKKDVLETCKFLENDFYLLIRHSSKLVGTLLDEIFPKVDYRSLSSAAYSTVSLPSYRLSKSESIDMKAFSIKENQEINPPIEFRSTKFKLGLDKGSEESFTILKNLCQCNSKRNLDSSLVQAIYFVKIEQHQMLMDLQLAGIVFGSVFSFYVSFWPLYFLCALAALYVARERDLLFYCAKSGLVLYFCVESIPLAVLLGMSLIVLNNRLLRTADYKVLGMCIKNVWDRMCPVFALGLFFLQYFITYSEAAFSRYYQITGTESFGVGISRIVGLIFFICVVLEMFVVGADKKLWERLWVESFHCNIKEILNFEKIYKGKTAEKYFLQSCSLPVNEKKSELKKEMKEREFMNRIVRMNQESVNAEIEKFNGKLELLINK